VAGHCEDLRFLDYLGFVEDLVNSCAALVTVHDGHAAVSKDNSVVTVLVLRVVSDELQSLLSTESEVDSVLVVGQLEDRYHSEHRLAVETFIVNYQDSFLRVGESVSCPFDVLVNFTALFEDLLVAVVHLLLIADHALRSTLFLFPYFKGRLENRTLPVNRVHLDTSTELFRNHLGNDEAETDTVGVHRLRRLEAAKELE